MNRVTARILNSFEENRIQSEAFHGVQEGSTIQRYAKYWSRVVVFLLYVIVDKSFEPFTSFYFDTDEALKTLVRRLSNPIYDLLAISSGNIKMDKLFTINTMEEDEDRLVERAASKARSHAKELSRAVAQLSFYLVRFEFHESPFASPVVGFKALNTLEINGLSVV